jgi:thiamine-phosphate pyrophosphorylase
MTQTRRIDFTDVSLYAVTPEPKDPSIFLRRIEAVLAGGADALQFRAKSLPDKPYLELGAQVRELCRKANALFLVDNRPDLATLLDADGVHVGHLDMPVASARQFVGHRKIVGRSAHSLPEALEAQKAGADYVSCGPVWATPTKPEYPAVGLGLIGLYKAAMRVPFVVIGGVDQSNIDQVVEAGATCVAVVRALFDAPDPSKAAQFFKDKMKVNRSRAAAV